MDWFLADGRHDDAAATRKEIVSYLRRHGEPTSDYAGAELICSELISNAVRHALGPAWVSLRWLEEYPTLTVTDLGPGFDLHGLQPASDDRTGGRGLQIAGTLAMALKVHRRHQGSAVSSVLPVRRPAGIPLDPPRHRRNVLPALEEARPAGGFGLDSFLRALVVQLAQGVEELDGPDRAQAVVAQVGADVGGQMEAEFRRAHGLDGRLTTEQIATCLVRLKGAINGGFSIEEILDGHIILVNDRCPFGEAVQRAPALCRMTSSVFGGIAARNSDHNAVVVLEERIALGDARCRVHVVIDPPPAVQPAGHRYSRPR